MEDLAALTGLFKIQHFKEKTVNPKMHRTVPETHRQNPSANQQSIKIKFRNRILYRTAVGEYVKWVLNQIYAFFTSY